MAQVKSISQFVCPGCSESLIPESDGPTSCPKCRWAGEVYRFTPRVIDAQAPESALPEDAACLHHPRKKATAVCAGTGDYICSLCTVELNGQTYGAEYLNNAGKEKVGKTFERKLPRPDSQARMYILLCFIPPMLYVMVPFAFLWLPYAFILYFRALRMRGEDEVFARVMSPWRVVMLPIMLSLIAIGWFTGAVALTLLFLNRHR